MGAISANWAAYSLSARSKHLAPKRRRKRGLEGLRRQWIEAREPAEHRHAAKSAQSALVVRLRITDQRDAEDGNAAPLQCFQRQQRVVQSAELGPGAQHHRRTPLRKDIDEQDPARERNHEPA